MGRVTRHSSSQKIAIRKCGNISKLFMLLQLLVTKVRG